MIKELFPEGDAVFRDKHLSPELFSLTLDEIDRAGESFIGIMRVDEGEASYFLFFLGGETYAAGCIKDGKPMPMSIKDFFHQMSADLKRTISLYKTDPVLFKGMLVLLQREPSIKATTDMINIENILSQITKEKTAAFLILKKSGRHNFFYIHSGEPRMAHFSDAREKQDALSIAEQILLYAYPPDKTSVEVMVYLDIKTSEAADKAGIKPFLISEVMGDKKEAGASTSTPAAARPQPAEGRPARVRIEITGGPQKGNKFNLPLPFTIGRRDADIRVRDMTVSKRHASFEASGGRIIFKDLGSTNGSMVNGKTVTETELTDGDTIQIGNTTLRIQFVTS